jgi:DNA-binding GntR family transcriptional regulator
MTVANDIYKILKSEIIDGTLSQDTPLREIELAKRFGCSRTPIREALQWLSSENLVRSIPNTATFVSGLSWETAREIFSIRQVLEAYAAGLAAIFMSYENKSKLEDLYHEMEKCVESQDTDEYGRLDEIFHEIINDSCDNQQLIQIISSLNDKAKLSKLRQDLYGTGRMDESLRDHRRIIDSIKNNKPKQANQELLTHGQNIFGEVTQAHILEIYTENED